MSNLPDRKAPRFRKTTFSVLNRRFYKEFKKKYPQYKDVPRKELGEIIKVFNGLLQETAAENRNGVELPEGLGVVFVGSCPPPKFPNIDYKTSHKYGKIVRYRNFNSDNRLAKICYTNYTSKYKFQHREIWKFVALKPFKTLAHKAFSKNWAKYVQIDNFVNISKAFLKGSIIPE